MITYKTLLAGTDLSAVARRALDAAAFLAPKLGSERIHLVHVIAHPPPTVLEQLADRRREQVLEEIAVEVDHQLSRITLPQTTALVSHSVLRGPPAKMLAAAALESPADLIIVASHGRGAVGRFLLGSVADGLVRESSVPVLVLRGEKTERGGFRRVLAPIDLSPLSERVLLHALSMAKSFSGEVRALSIYEPVELAPAGEEEMLPRFLKPEELNQIRDGRRSEVERMVRRVAMQGVAISTQAEASAHPARAILDVAERWPADLIVLGAHGHNTLERALLGTTTGRVLAHSEVPVLVVSERLRRPL
jgi:nucleotide-binding universal stress UspA family protein